MITIEDSEKLSYDDVLLKPLMSNIASRSDVDLTVQFGRTVLKKPIISSNMDTITGVKMAKKMAELGGLGLVHRYMSVEENLNVLNDWNWKYPLGVSTGILSRDKDRIDSFIYFAQSNPGADIVVCVDIAHGHSLHMIETLKYIRSNGFEGTLMAGAVCTSEGVMDLLESGADVVRVGVGPGSACKTRTKTGSGMPQFSAIADCGHKGQIIADGGIREPGDAAKAIAAGATAVMIGGILAGTDCVPGWDLAMESYKAIAEEGKPPPSIKFRGMASAAARESFGHKGVHEEGISTTVKAKPEGSTEEVIVALDEGIRSACSYSGASNIPDFQRKARFIKVTPSAVKENRPHILDRK